MRLARRLLRPDAAPPDAAAKRQAAALLGGVETEGLSPPVRNTLDRLRAKAGLRDG